MVKEAVIRGRVLKELDPDKRAITVSDAVLAGNMETAKRIFRISLTRNNTSFDILDPEDRRAIFKIAKDSLERRKLEAEKSSMGFELLEVLLKFYKDEPKYLDRHRELLKEELSIARGTSNRVELLILAGSDSAKVRLLVAKNEEASINLLHQIRLSDPDNNVSNAANMTLLQKRQQLLQKELLRV